MQVLFYFAPWFLFTLRLAPWPFFFALRLAPWPFCFFALAGGRGIQARSQRAKEKGPEGPLLYA